MVLVVRQDLKMGKGKVAAQVGEPTGIVKTRNSSASFVTAALA